MTLAPDDPRHGTCNGYGYHGCRCDSCRAASTAYHKARGSAGYAKDPCPRCDKPKRTIAAQCQECRNRERAASHGTESRYSRCRCEECRAAASQARAQRRRQLTSEQRDAVRARDRERRARSRALQASRAARQAASPSETPRDERDALQEVARASV